MQGIQAGPTAQEIDNKLNAFDESLIDAGLEADWTTESKSFEEKVRDGAAFMLDDKELMPETYVALVNARLALFENKDDANLRKDFYLKHAANAEVIRQAVVRVYET